MKRRGRKKTFCCDFCGARDNYFTEDGEENFDRYIPAWAQRLPDCEEHEEKRCNACCDFVEDLHHEDALRVSWDRRQADRVYPRWSNA